MSTWQPLGPPPGEADPRRMGELLDRATRRLGAPTSATTSTVFSRWEQVVGPDIAAHARPVSLHNGVLVLAVDTPAWAAQLRYMTTDLLARIHEATSPPVPAPGSRAGAAGPSPEVEEIRIRVAGDQPSGKGAGKGRKARP